MRRLHLSRLALLLSIGCGARDEVLDYAAQSADVTGGTSAGNSTASGGHAASGTKASGGSAATTATTIIAGGGNTSGGGTKSTGGSSGGSGATKATGGTTGSGGSTAPSSLYVTDDGCVINSVGTLHGYAYAILGGASSQISMSFGSHNSICASGVVPAATAYTNYEAIGFYVNQPCGGAGAGGPAGTYVPQGYGIDVTFSNPGASPLRLQITDNTTTWCYDIGAGSGAVLVPWQDFNTSCWDMSGSYYSQGIPIRAIQLQVVGDAAYDTKFDYCLLDAVEIWLIY